MSILIFTPNFCTIMHEVYRRLYMCCNTLLLLLVIIMSYYIMLNLKLNAIYVYIYRLIPPFHMTNFKPVLKRF